MARFWALVIGLICIDYVSSQQGPTVTLPHGGQLKGISTTSQKTPIDVFLGIRYAKPPVGELRFKRPEEFPAWSGEMDATKSGTSCPQPGIGEGMEMSGVAGKEDCLFMDIYVPGGVDKASSKAVMVWLHGGGYVLGSGIGYPAGILAVIGDVIVVTLNYRIGALGFLSQGEGTGNFGLWDQRAALLWVKKNVASFGGDPDLVTIFGESAGGGSVSAQTMGIPNDGLFKRAIQQSGTLMQPWGFLKSKNQVAKEERKFRDKFACSEDQCLYDCLRDVTLDRILEDFSMLEHTFHPSPDGDFIPADIVETGCYNLSKRFDMMSGMCGEEGSGMLVFDTATSLNISISDGMSLAEVREYLTLRCKTMITKYSPELCAHFVIKTYKIDEEGIDGEQRALRVRDFMNALMFDGDVINNLQQHSTSEATVTYAYYFTEVFDPALVLVPIPDYLRSSANHGDDLPFVFGAPFMSDDGESELWKEISNLESLLGAFIINADQKHRDLSHLVMTSWSNFAKSGDPNKPNPLPVEWPKFTTESGQFLELKTGNVRVIDTPNKERNAILLSHLFSARRRQLPLDLPDAAEDSEPENKKHDEL